VPETLFEESLIEFSQSVGLLSRRLRAAAAKDLAWTRELSWTQGSVVARLYADGSATTADLARAENIKPQSMRAVISALEQMELVARKPHPTDGRQVVLHLTEKGVAMRERLTSAKRTWLAHAVEQLSEEERQRLFEAGHIIKRLVEL
jgi:DNA-binding MarR family transcriptional regulator